MKKLLLGAGLLAVAAAAQPAAAADLTPLKSPPPVYETWSWTGFYIGGNGGYSWGQTDTSVYYYNPATGGTIVAPVGSVLLNRFDLNGGVAGGQIGYNWQSGNWVLGLETDIQWSGQDGSAVFLCSAISATATGPCLPGLATPGAGGTSVLLSEKLQWFGTFRGRLGLLWTPSVMGYVTGGLAYGSIQTQATLNVVNPAGAIVPALFSNKSTNTGFAVGAGIEGRITGNWTGKIEYLYMDLGSIDATVLSTVAAAPIGARIHSDITDNIVRVGLNYKFGGPTRY
jgi:outer membrane immunogenic protein